MELLTAENLTFLLPLVAAVLLVLSMCIGLPMGDHGVHVHLDAHPGVHVGGHFGGHIGGHVGGHFGGHVGPHFDVSGHGAHVGDGHVHGHGAGGHGAHGVMQGVLSFFGIGKVPFAVVIVSVCLVWGVTGLALGLLALKWTLGVKMMTAGVAAMLGTNLVGSGLSRALPAIESYAVETEALVNERAEVIHEVTAAGGVARLVDGEGNLRDLACCVEPGAATLARGTKVVLMNYDASTERFMVATDSSGQPG